MILCLRFPMAAKCSDNNQFSIVDGDPEHQGVHSERV